MRIRSLIAFTAFAGVTAASASASAAPTLEDYRHYRALSIDLVGRVPTRAA